MRAVAPARTARERLFREDHLGPTRGTVAPHRPAGPNARLHRPVRSTTEDRRRVPLPQLPRVDGAEPTGPRVVALPEDQ